MRSTRTRSRAGAKAIPTLPAKWLEFLDPRNIVEREVNLTASRSDLQDWLEDRPDADSSPCLLMQKAIDVSLEELELEDDNAHDVINRKLYHIVTNAAEGHVGVLSGLTQLYDKFMEMVHERRIKIASRFGDDSKKPRGEKEAHEEFYRSRDGVIRLLLGDEDTNDSADSCYCMDVPERSDDPNAVGYHAVYRAPETYRQTDLGFGEHFFDLHKWDFVWLSDQETWLLWNGQTWERDRLGHVNAWAEKVGHRLHDAALLMAEEAVAEDEAGNAEEASAIGKRAEKLDGASKEAHQAPRIKRILEIARAQYKVARLHHDFDTRPDLLGVGNGVLELREDGSVNLRPGARDDYVTRSAAVEYVDGYTSEELEEFLDTFVPNPDVQRYLQKFMGYTLYGRNVERRMGFFIGASTSGKSTFLESFALMLGDYGGSLALSIFSGNMVDRPRPDVISAKPMRFLGASELSSKTPLHADQIKKVVSNDTITVRGMRQDEFNNDPICFTPIIASNVVPDIPGADNGLKRRLVVFPWNEELTEADPRWREGHAERLKDSAEFLTALLAWAAAGWGMYVKEGLSEMPRVMHEAAQAFLSNSSPFQDWFSSTFIEDVDGWAATDEIAQSYEQWCSVNSIKEEFRLSIRRGLPSALEDMRFHRAPKVRKIGGEVKRVRKGYRFRTDGEIKPDE